MTPYEEGFEVGYEDGFADENPYDLDTAEYLDWDRGYGDGIEEFEAEQLSYEEPVDAEDL